MSDKGLSRRELFSLFRRRDAEPEDAPARAAQPTTPPPPKYVRDTSLPVPLRPPGALDEQALADACIRCSRCVEACPVNALSPLPEAYGAWAGTPFLIARSQPCVLCEGLQCTTVCPTGALRPLTQRDEVDMGFAVRDWQRCQSFFGTPCDDCSKACPVAGAIYFDAHGHPHVAEQRCTGCGMCEKACPMEPSAIVVEPHSARGAP